MVSAARRRRRRVDIRQRHASRLGKFAERRNLISSTYQLRVTMAAVDVEYRDAPGVSPLRVERYLIFWPWEHFGEGNGYKVGTLRALRLVEHLHTEASPWAGY
jgi:hypothetical protein